MTGFVSFVSSGPGDPELLTVRAVSRLQAADVVLFDDLSGGPILIGVGKRAGHPSPKQDHVSQLLVEYATSGQRVVRLKSGDAGIFGRLEEETNALTLAGIGYEIIPGVTSASAAAAAVGIPLTRRFSARRVQFITGADVTGALPEDVNMAALADPLATTIVYMGKSTFSILAARLIANGLSSETPAILAHGVSTPEQIIERFSILSLVEHLERVKNPNPALIIYGPLSPDWRE
jgi:uroporphyrin-III C-methyltransferase